MDDVLQTIYKDRESILVKYQKMSPPACTGRCACVRCVGPVANHNRGLSKQAVSSMACTPFALTAVALYFPHRACLVTRGLPQNRHALDLRIQRQPGRQPQRMGGSAGDAGQ